MTPETYADAIGEITLTGSVLRIDFVSLSATQRDANNNPVREIRQRILMPIEGYAGSFELLSRVFDGLVEAGAVARQPPANVAPFPQSSATKAPAWWSISVGVLARLKKATTLSRCTSRNAAPANRACRARRTCAPRYARRKARG